MIFTNIGFAVFLTFANTCFSWARSFTEERHRDTVRRINRISYFSIICALTFLLSSLAQFLITVGTSSETKHFVFDTFVWILTAIRMIMVFSVLILSFGILFEAFSILKKLMFKEYIDLQKDRNNETANGK
jgi:hypothetical protein